MDLIYRKKYELQSYEVDIDKNARLTVLLDYLQDAARLHAATKSLSIFDLHERNLTWILSRYHIRVARYPRMGEVVEVQTWPSGKHGYFALRDYEILDKDGRQVLVATCSFLALGRETKQAIKLDELVPDEFVLSRRVLFDEFRSIPALEKTEHETDFRVLMRDLDFNRHVNNVVYIHWALESVPAEVLKSEFPVDVEISYKAEAFYGDEITSRVQTWEADPAGRGHAFLHQIVNRAGTAELARLRTVWSPAPR